MAEIVYIGNVVPFNEQEPNYQGSQASGAKGKQKPTVKEEKKDAD